MSATKPTVLLDTSSRHGGSGLLLGVALVLTGMLLFAGVVAIVRRTPRAAPVGALATGSPAVHFVGEAFAPPTDVSHQRDPRPPPARTSELDGATLEQPTTPPARSAPVPAPAPAPSIVPETSLASEAASPEPAVPHCTVTWWRGYVRSQFIAYDSAEVASAPVAESPPFAWRSNAPPPPNDDAVAAHRRLLERLAELGWERVDVEGASWYEATFRRIEALAEYGSPE